MCCGFVVVCCTVHRCQLYAVQRMLLTSMKDPFLKCNGQCPDSTAKCGLLVCPVYTVNAHTTARNIAIDPFNFII
jgi:hypothetical protein